jgi:hypothetical protein
MSSSAADAAAGLFLDPEYLKISGIDLVVGQAVGYHRFLQRQVG